MELSKEQVDILKDVDGNLPHPARWLIADVDYLLVNGYLHQNTSRFDHIYEVKEKGKEYLDQLKKEPKNDNVEFEQDGTALRLLIDLLYEGLANCDEKVPDDMVLQLLKHQYIDFRDVGGIGRSFTALVLSGLGESLINKALKKIGNMIGDQNDNRH